jgi:hypothetical protein
MTIRYTGNFRLPDDEREDLEAQVRAHGLPLDEFVVDVTRHDSPAMPPGSYVEGYVVIVTRHFPSGKVVHQKYNGGHGLAWIPTLGRTAHEFG